MAEQKPKVTASSIMKKLSKQTDIALAVGVMFILVIMIIPIPAFLPDTFQPDSVYQVELSNTKSPPILVVVSKNALPVLPMPARRVA